MIPPGQALLLDIAQVGSLNQAVQRAAPDGKTAYVTSGNIQPGAVIPISTATNRAGKPIFTSRSHFVFGERIAITP